MRPAVDILSEFYQANRRELFLYALALTVSRSAAEDAVHDTFARLLAAQRTPAELRPYVFRCLRNAAVDQHRLRTRHVETPFSPGNGQVHTPLYDQRMDLETALKTLPSDERETIVLKVYAGFTFNEIAAMREAPLNTVASWYRRGLEKLRTFLEEAEV